MSTVTSGTLKDPVTLVTKSGKYGLPYYPLGETEESHPFNKTFIPHRQRIPRYQDSSQLNFELLSTPYSTNHPNPGTTGSTK